MQSLWCHSKTTEFESEFYKVPWCLIYTLKFDKPWSSSVVSKPGNNATNISWLAPLSHYRISACHSGLSAPLPRLLPLPFPWTSILLTVLLNSIPNCCHCVSALENTSSLSQASTPLARLCRSFPHSVWALTTDVRLPLLSPALLCTLLGLWHSTWAATATVYPAQVSSLLT